MKPFDPVPVSVLTGFLGAGKTTLLNRLLRDPELTDTAVIINEFGDVAIDHLLVESSSDGVIELADGCLCCTVRGELVDTLADLIDRLQTGRINKLSRVVVETTGLADPVPVLQSLMAHPVLAQAYRLDGVITLVDAVNGEATLDKHSEALKQVAVADRLVISKRDLASAEALDRLSARLRALNPSALMLPVENASVATLFDAGLYDPRTKSADVVRWLGEVEHHDHHQHHGHDHHGHHDHDDHHHHDHSHHDKRIRSFSLTYDRPIPYAALEMFLDLLRSVHGEQLLRMKGVVQIAEQPDRPVVIHGVQKLLHPIVRLPVWPAGQNGGMRLVIIGFDLAEEHVRRLFAAITDQPGVDQPDRAATQENPLAIAGM